MTYREEDMTYTIEVPDKGFTATKDTESAARKVAQQLADKYDRQALIYADRTKFPGVIPVATVEPSSWTD